MAFKKGKRGKDKGRGHGRGRDTGGSGGSDLLDRMLEKSRDKDFSDGFADKSLVPGTYRLAVMGNKKLITKRKGIRKQWNIVDFEIDEILNGDGSKRVKEGAECQIWFQVGDCAEPKLVELLRFGAAYMGCSVKDEDGIAEFTRLLDAEELGPEEGDEDNAVLVECTAVQARTDDGEPMTAGTGAPILNYRFMPCTDEDDE